MPRSKIFLPDVNVWLALASRRHVHATVCSEWLNSIESEEVVFCRVTQMGLLRLLTNESVMGADVLTCRKAWGAYRNILADPRIHFAVEPFSLEPEWCKASSSDHAALKIWTDAYLVAFARVAGMQLVSLDRGIKFMAPDALLLHTV
jgi:toxin-antitoxin system PIN domain toxin